MLERLDWVEEAREARGARRAGRARAGFDVFRDFDVACFGQKGYNL